MRISCPRCGGCGEIDEKDPVAAKKERLIELAHAWFALHGKPPTIRDWKDVKGTRWPSYQTCMRAFGSWDNFIAACGWQPRGRGRPVR